MSTEIMSPAHLADLKGRAERRFKRIDQLPKATREVIHEFGWRAVKVFVDLGITDPRTISRAIREIRDARRD